MVLRTASGLLNISNWHQRVMLKVQYKAAVTAVKLIVSSNHFTLHCKYYDAIKTTIYTVTLNKQTFITDETQA
jgi:hypothetical protein